MKVKSIGILFLLMAGGSFVKAQPLIETFDGVVIADGAEITIKGSSFSEKVNDKPWFFWSADTGLDPTDLGRNTSWNSSDQLRGEIVGPDVDKAVIAPGSAQSARYDLSKGGAVLASVQFETPPLKMYAWRKRYDDFDRNTHYSTRTRFSNFTLTSDASSYLTAEQITAINNDEFNSDDDPSMKSWYVSRSDADVHGEVLAVVGDASSNPYITYERGIGNIYEPSAPASKFDVFNVYVDIDHFNSKPAEPFATFESNESAGIYHTFNHKTIRFWGETNNTYISLGSISTSVLGNSSAIVNERTQVKTFSSQRWTNIIENAAYRWVWEEYEYTQGTKNSHDGYLSYSQNGVNAWNRSDIQDYYASLGWEDEWNNITGFRFTTDDYPGAYKTLYFNQISNGAMPGTYEYYDAIYIDDSFHRVIACVEDRIENCSEREVQVPSYWDDGSIKIKLRIAGLMEDIREKNTILAEGTEKTWDQFPQTFYIYVFDEDGNFNTEGFPVCINCPSKT